MDSARRAAGLRGGPGGPGLVEAPEIIVAHELPEYLALDYRGRGALCDYPCLPALLSKGKRRIRRILPRLKASAVTSIQFRPAEQDEIRGLPHQWHLADHQPLAYPAQGVSIERFLAELGRLTPATYITARVLQDRPQTDEEYGFAAPQASITVEQPGYVARVRVGAKTTPGDQAFLQVVGVEGVYVVNADFLKYLPRTADDWRTRR